MAGEYKWYATRDRETYIIGPCDTKEEAIAAAIESEVYTEEGDFITIQLAEACKHTIADLEIDADDVLERLEDAHEEWQDEDGSYIFTDVGPAERLDLSQMLTQTLRDWVERHHLKIESYMFKDMRECCVTVEKPLWDDK